MTRALGFIRDVLVFAALISPIYLAVQWGLS